MRLQLYDRGTPQGKKLFADLETVCRRLQIDFDPEYIKDMSRVYAQGIQGRTVLMIDGDVVFVDRYPDIRELENIISDYLK
ncbi:thioredoxin family protein [Patescibacteria group bacterium]|nr:thioredoxin family protein [Patescibacteria group bacterium]